MRLIDTVTGDFKEFSDTKATPYAILSYVWSSQGEQSYDDIRQIQASFRPSSSAPPSSPRTMPTLGSLIQRRSSRTRSTSREQPSILTDPRISEKVRRACEVARSHGYRYIWIDSCCIDKSSSAELSEAINSMFIWYRDAEMCYTFLADVPSDEDPYAEASLFSCSRWFTRGWTLQELIAPRVLVFLSQDWAVLGTRATLSKVVERVTGVDEAILAHRQRLDEISVAKRMSWAAGRETTRVEDKAYSLLGIFDINMPTLYGEGPRAFMRLQEEILRRIPDQTIFAWGEICPLSSIRKGQTIDVPEHASLFAPSPSYFKDCGRIGTVPHGVLAARLGAHLKVLPLPEYTVSAYGIRTQFPLVSLFDSCRLPPALIPDSFNAWYLAILACDLPSGDLLALVCYPDHSRADITLKSGRFYPKGSRHSRKACRLLALSQHDTLTLPELYIENVYIEPVHMSNLPHRSPASKSETASPLHKTTVALAGWSEAGLRQQGYTVTRHGTVFLLCNGETHVAIAVNLSSPADSDVRCMRQCTHSLAVTVELWPPGKEDCTQKTTMFQCSGGTSSTVCVTLRQLSAMSLLLMEIKLTDSGRAGAP